MKRLVKLIRVVYKAEPSSRVANGAIDNAKSDVERSEAAAVHRGPVSTKQNCSLIDDEAVPALDKVQPANKQVFCLLFPLSSLLSPFPQ